MAAAQAYRPNVSQYEGSSATRLRNTRTNSQHQQQQQSTASTTTQGGSCSQPPQSQQYASNIGGSSNSGNGSTIPISTITSAPGLSRVRRIRVLFFVERKISSDFSHVREKKE